MASSNYGTLSPATADRPHVTSPSVAYLALSVVALTASLGLALLKVQGWGPFVGYLLAPLVVITAIALAVLERNRNDSNPYFEHTVARRNLRLLTGLALVSLAPAAVHSLHIARQVTLWLQ